MYGRALDLEDGLELKHPLDDVRARFCRDACLLLHVVTIRVVLDFVVTDEVVVSLDVLLGFECVWLGPKEKQRRRCFLVDRLQILGGLGTDDLCEVAVKLGLLLVLNGNDLLNNNRWGNFGNLRDLLRRHNVC